MNRIEIFENTEFGKIRALNIDGEPWFIGKDVALALGYSDTKSALSDSICCKTSLVHEGFQSNTARASKRMQQTKHPLCRKKT